MNECTKGNLPGAPNRPPPAGAGAPNNPPLAGAIR